jgi:hypothetical protein
MEDLSARAEGSLWTVSQHADSITGRPAAMSAPGGESFPGWSRVGNPPDPPAVEVHDLGNGARHLERGRGQS